MIPIYLLTYDRPEYLFCTLDNLTKNTVYPYRLYVGTADKSVDTRKVIFNFMHRREVIDGVKYFSENDFRKNRDRLVREFNIRSRYIVMIDDDILVERWWLSKLKGLMDRFREFGIMTVDLDETDMPSKKNWLTPERKKDTMIWCARERYNNEIDEIETAAGLVIIRKSVYDKIGKFRRDHNFAIEVRKLGYRVGIAKNIKVRHLGQNLFYDYPNYKNANESISNNPNL